MDRQFLIVSAVIFLAACQQPCPEAPALDPALFQGWEPIPKGRVGPDGMFVSEDGRFFIAFPGMPVHTSETVQTDAGPVRSEQFVYEESATQAFMVAYADHPTAFVRAQKPDVLLSRAKAGVLGPLGIDGVDGQEDLMINGYPGLRFRGHAAGPHVVTQLLLAGNRMYQLTILRDGSYPTEAVIDQFFGSFHQVTPSQAIGEEEPWWPEEMDGK